MKIRTATLQDACDMAKIHVQAWRSGYEGIMSAEYLRSQSVETRTEEWSEALSTSSPGINLVIELEEAIVGFCVYGPARDSDLSHENSGELVALNISPNYWSMGLGSELIKHVISDSDKRMWQSLYLWVLEGNSRARRLYEYMGFENTGTAKTDVSITGNELRDIRYVYKRPLIWKTRLISPEGQYVHK